MRADVLGFRKVEAEEGCVVTVLAESDQLGLLQRMREYERSPWWLRLFCPRSYLVQGFAINLFLEAPFPIQCEEARKDGVAIEEQKRRRLIGIQAHGRAWWEASLLLSEAFSRPSQGMAGFSTLEAVFSGGGGEGAKRLPHPLPHRHARATVRGGGVVPRRATYLGGPVREERPVGVGPALGEGGWREGCGSRQGPLGGNPVRGDYHRRGRGGPTSGIAGGGLQAMGR
jgi:hypothetical protein